MYPLQSLLHLLPMVALAGQRLSLAFDPTLAGCDPMDPVLCRRPQ